MDEKVTRGYQVLVCDINDALKHREKFQTFAVGDRYEHDFILSNVFYFKAYTNYNEDNPHYIVLKREVAEISGYPNLKSDMKKEFIEDTHKEIEGKI